jgi:hypothetical protein
MNAAAGFPETARNIRRRLRDTAVSRKSRGPACSPSLPARKSADGGLVVWPRGPGNVANTSSMVKKIRRLPSCGQCCAQLFLSGLCLIARPPAMAIDGCRWPLMNPASLSGRSRSMLYFIELSQFLAEDEAVVQALRAQMGPHKGEPAHWAEWRTGGSNHPSCPDVALINAARLD